MSEQIDYSQFILKAAEKYRQAGMFNRYGILKDAADQFKFMVEQIDKINTEMPCGHLARYSANMENGTEYCVMCLVVDRTNNVIHESIERDDLIATIKNAFELLEDDHIDAAQAILQMKFEKEQS